MQLDLTVPSILSHPPWPYCWMPGFLVLPLPLCPCLAWPLPLASVSK